MASQTIPNFMVGRNVSAFLGAGLFINSAGNVVPGNILDFHQLGTLDLFEYTMSNGNVEISALDAPIENNLPTKLSLEFSVGEIKQPGGSSFLQNVSFNQTSLFGFEAYVQDPATGAGTQLSMTGRIISVGDGYMQGKNVYKITCASAGVLPYYVVYNSAGQTSAQNSGISSGSVLRGNVVTGAR